MDSSGIAIIVGALLPMAISVINRVDWQRSYKEIAAFATCIAAALATSIVSGQLSGIAPVEAFAIIYTTARATYLVVWKPTGVSPAIEKRTG